MSPSGPILFAYDASPHARAAIDQAGSLLVPGPAVVVTAWSTLETAAAGALIALPNAIVSEAVADIDAATREDAESIAAEGAKLAAAAGFDAQPQVIRSAGAVFAAIVACAEELDAAAIVMGSRGRSTLAATLLGSVSTGVLHHTTRPVLIARTA
jgi:nucleotide-binding universal stress UspA family protein